MQDVAIFWTSRLLCQISVSIVNLKTIGHKCVKCLPKFSGAFSYSTYSPCHVLRLIVKVWLFMLGLAPLIWVHEFSNQNLGVLNCHGSEKNISKSSNNPRRSLGHFRWITIFFSFRLSFSFTAQMTRAAHVICLPKTVNKNMTLCSDATGEVLIALRKFKKFAFLHVASLICA